jgi:hypothetical protein
LRSKTKGSELKHPSRGHGSEEIQYAKAGILILLVNAVIAVPIAGNTLRCACKELRVRLKKVPVKRIVQRAEIGVDDADDFNTVFSEQLDNERRHPRISRADYLLQMLLADETVMMPRQQAIDEFFFKISEMLRLNLAGRVIQAVRYSNRLTADLHRELASRWMLRFRECFCHHKRMLPHGQRKSIDEAGVQRAHRRLVYSV